MEEPKNSFNEWLPVPGFELPRLAEKSDDSVPNDNDWQQNDHP